MDRAALDFYLVGKNRYTKGFIIRHNLSITLIYISVFRHASMTIILQNYMFWNKTIQKPFPTRINKQVKTSFVHVNKQ